MIGTHIYIYISKYFSLFKGEIIERKHYLINIPRTIFFYELINYQPVYIFT